jgi:hypothetical protein
VESPAPVSMIVKFSGDRSPAILKNVAVRTGLYAGLALALIFTAWVMIATRVPFSDRFSTELNIIAVALVLFFACVPLIRFYRSPVELLISGLLAWGLLTLTYRIFGLVLGFFEEDYSAFQVFVLGALSYLIFATLSWIGTIIWRVRATDLSHSHH